MEVTTETPPVPKRVLRPTLPREHLMELDRALDTPRQRARAAAARLKRRDSARRAIRWTTLPGIVIGLWLGIVYDIATDGTLSEDAAAIVADQFPSGRGDALITIVSKDAAQGNLNLEAAASGSESPIPLTLAATGGLDGEPVAIKLMGLPESFRLTKGFREEGGAWTLPPGDEQGVELIAPVVPPEPVTIAVAAVDPMTGEPKGPVKEIEVKIEPASGPPQAKIMDRLE